MNNHTDRMRLRQKQPRFKLKPEVYATIRNQVLERDGWRCQDCGAMKDLQVHHIKPRSQLGGDASHKFDYTLCRLSPAASRIAPVEVLAGKTALQLRAPVWERYAEDLFQARVREDRVGGTRCWRAEFYR